MSHIEVRARVGRPQTSSSPAVSFLAGRPKAALLFWFFGDVRCGALLFMVIHVIYYGVAIARRLAIANTRGKCYCQTSGNSTKSGKMLLPDVW